MILALLALVAPFIVRANSAAGGLLDAGVLIRYVAFQRFADWQPRLPHGSRPRWEIDLADKRRDADNYNVDGWRRGFAVFQQDLIELSLIFDGPIFPAVHQRVKPATSDAFVEAVVVIDVLRKSLGNRFSENVHDFSPGLRTLAVRCVLRLTPGGR